MIRRLGLAGVVDVTGSSASQPKHARASWRNVTGERLWYASHGYAIEAPETERNMFGHGRVSPPDQRSSDDARAMGRSLSTKAARRMRRSTFYASASYSWLKGYERGSGDVRPSGEVQDDIAILQAFTGSWDHVVAVIPPRTQISRIMVTSGELTGADARQPDSFANDDRDRQRAEELNRAMDGLNARYGQTVVSVGPWEPPVGGNVGTKISYTRIPDAEDDWCRKVRFVTPAEILARGDYRRLWSSE
ncbi:hypothetical protein OY671_008324, partial [Metschnikowia pulcherrima]